MTQRKRGISALEIQSELDNSIDKSATMHTDKKLIYFATYSYKMEILLNLKDRL